MKNLPASEIIESTSVAKAGFINIILSNAWIAKVNDFPFSYRLNCFSHASIIVIS